MSEILNAQTDVTSYRNYTYPIFLKEKNGKIRSNGSCFLFKKDTRFFIISNYHVLVGWDPTGKTMHEIDSFYILNNNHVFLSGPAGEDIVDKVEKLGIHEMLDLHAVEFTPPPGLNLYFINDIIDTSYFDKKPSNVIIYGYPSTSQQIINGVEMKVNKAMYVGNVVDGFLEYTKQLVNDNKNASLSQIENVIKNKFQPYYLLVSPGVLSGNSGAPVLGEYLKGKTVEYKFTGVYFATKPEWNKSWIIKSNVVCDYLNRL